MPSSPTRSPRSGCSASTASVAACSRARSANASSTSACSATAPSKSASPAPYNFGAGSPGRIQLRQSRSTSARWRSSPSNDMVDGGTDRRASCSGSNPLALHLQGQSVVPQVVLQRRQLAVRAHSATVASVLFRLYPHVGEDGGPAPPLGQVTHHTDSAQRLSHMQLDIHAAGDPTCTWVVVH